jgi:uncharacterized protein YcbK (DUF882 family)
VREKLTENFYRDEFACKCGCGFDDIDMRVVRLCQMVRDFFDAPVKISSGCRCPAHNKKERGSPRSQHLLGTAADIKVRHVPPSVVHEYCESLDPGGLGSYPTFTHIDVRDGEARW